MDRDGYRRDSAAPTIHYPITGFSDFEIRNLEVTLEKKISICKLNYYGTRSINQLTDYYSYFIINWFYCVFACRLINRLKNVNRLRKNTTLKTFQFF